MTSITQKFWTYEMNSDILLIDETFLLTSLSIICTAGVGTITGNITAGGKPSTSITLNVGMPVTINSESNNIISGLLIDGSGGNISLIGKQ
jgi:heme/copper-type cytochrome/quinol oxidase subunit 2